MTRNLLTLCAIGLATLTLSCTQAPKPAESRDADIQAIKDNETQWNKDYEAKDSERIAAHYTDDGVLMVPFTAPITGKDAIRSALKEMVADPAFSLKFQTARSEAASSGEMGYTQGSYELTVKDPATKKPVNDHGSYVTVYKKQPDGSWKAVADIAASSTPPAPPPVAQK